MYNHFQCSCHHNTIPDCLLKYRYWLHCAQNKHEVEVRDLTMHFSVFSCLSSGEADSTKHNPTKRVWQCVLLTSAIEDPQSTLSAANQLILSTCGILNLSTLNELISPQPLGPTQQSLLSPYLTFHMHVMSTYYGNLPT